MAIGQGQAVRHHPSTAQGLLHELAGAGLIPVIASIGSDAKGQLYNVNADTLAGVLAWRIKARRLVIAGSTAGVLDAQGQTIPEVDEQQLAMLIRDGHASAGMVAKLLACRSARRGGVERVAIVDGTRSGFLDARRRAGVTLVTGEG